jgi:hypothetical protein
MSSNKNCQNRREAIAALVLGELSSDAADELNKHIDTCQSCRRLYQALTEEEETIQSAFRAISDKSESIQDSLVEQFKRHPATLQEQMRPRRSSPAILSAIMRSKVTRLVAAAVIVIVAVLGAHRLIRPIDGATVALGQVVQNMKAMPWMRIISEQEEQWVAFESKVWAWKYADGSVVFSDYGKRESYKYAPTSQTITVTYLHEEKPPVEFSSAFSFVDSLLEETVQQGGKISREAGEYEGKAVEIYNMSVGGNGVAVGLQLYVDPESHLAIAGVIVFYGQNLFAAGNIEFEYPEDGPKNIYALGVPVTAKLLYEGVDSDVMFAAEQQKVKVLFAAGHADGLVTVLSEAQFEEGKVLAANYLAKIGGLQAIEPLEKLSAQWSGDEQDNPYAAAIQEIKERLEQDTTTETLVKDSEDSTENKAVTSLTPAVGLTGSGSIYDHFLFTRRNGPERQEETWTLVLAKVTAAGFELRDIDTRPRYEGPGYPWQRPLCVANGTVYCANNDRLEWISLVTGETGRLENLPSLTDDGIWWGACYDDGRLYAQSGERNRTLQVLDFRKRAYRDIVTLEHELERTPAAVSPEHKRLAYFVHDPNGWLLTVVDVESGEVTHPSEPIRFAIPSISSTGGYAPPMVWVDETKILFIRTERLGEQRKGHDFEEDHAVNKVSVIGVATGEMEDIGTLPGDPYMRFFRLNQKYREAGPRISIADYFGQLGIDLAERKLIEDETVLGDYLVSDGYLFYGEQELGPVQGDGRKDMEISPDGKRAIWEIGGRLLYHDSAGQTLVPVIDDGNAVGGPLWLKAEDLKAPTVTGGIPAGWIAFKDRPPEAEEDDDHDHGPRVARKNIKDHLVLTLETDKDTYLLHEPIELTLAFTSTTDANIQLESSRTLRFDMDYNDGWKDVECAVGPYEPNVETIVLGPWESISTTDALEIAQVGDYKIRCEYGRFDDPWRGELKDDVVFRVNAVDSPDQEQQLFGAKFSRLTARLRLELSTENYDRSWVYALIGDELVGMAGMGPKVVPHITETLKQEENGHVRELLYRVLKPLAGPEYLPFFQDRLAHGEAGPVCGWLYDLYRKGQDGSAQAFATLLSAMNHENAGVRRVVAEHLKGIYDPNIEACFDRAVDDENEEVSMIAASYLAAAEWLDLDEWLDVAAKKPTKARYIAARSITKRIEEHWNITRGELPSASWEEVSKDTEKLEQYRKVVQAWQEWASEHLRYSSGFFDRD